MWHDLTNQTIGLGFNREETDNSQDFFVHIFEADDVTKPVFLRLQKLIQWAFCVIAWLIILVGSYFKYILYKYLFEQYKLKELSPINILIISASAVQHVSIVLFVLGITLVVIGDASLEYIGQWFCVPTKLFIAFDIYYSYIAGLGLSIYRILYIKHDCWVKYKIGERNLLYVILLGGLFLAAFAVLVVNTHDYEEVARETCMTFPRRLMLQLLDAYEQSRGNASIYAWFANVRIALATVCFSMTITEITIYFVFFYHLYKHDNNERLGRLLEPKVIKLRNKNNAITFFGQFCSFVFEVSFGIATICAQLGKAPWFVMILLRVGCFTTMSVVEVLTSNPLRTRVFKF